VLVGLAVGWRVESSILEAAAGLALVLLVAYTFSWISAAMGLSVGSVEAANSAGFVWLFPLTFVSNTFVPAASLPAGWQQFAEWNPMSAFVGAVRLLFGNTELALEPDVWPLQNPFLASFLWIALLLAIFVPLSVRQYKKAASH